MPLVSIIIPVYKVEKYIEKCMQSLLDQTYGNFEALVVDDGSPDSSIALEDEKLNLMKINSLSYIEESLKESFCI